MGAVEKPVEHLNKMAFAYLNQIYPDTIKVEVNDYTAYFGGVKRPWSNLNEIKVNGASQATKRITDSDVFAVFQSRHSLSSDYQESHWKIHLSIDPRDLGKAWDIVYPLLLANNVPIFKTTRTSVAQRMLHEVNALDEEQLQALHLSAYDKELAIQDMVRVFNGMQITIYIEEGKEAQYNALLQEMEPLLYQAGIRPGIIDKSDRSLGLYSSIRHVGESYTSHEKVTGYKAVRIADEFKAIKLDWPEIQIDWSNFDYAKHISKATLTLQQVVDAQKKYEMAIINRREFIQACEVAAEYFTRWHKLLHKTDQPADLSEKSQQLFNTFKKWIDDGNDLVPTIKKQKTRKIKEAEDILDLSVGHEKKSLKFHYPLARNNAHRNLRTLLPQGMEAVSQKPHDKVSNPAEILARLDERRKKEFAVLKSKSLAHIPRGFVSSVVQEGLTATPLRNSSVLPLAPGSQSSHSETADKPRDGEVASDNRETESFLALNSGRLWATIAGLSLGLLIGLIAVAFLPPVISIAALISTALVGTVLGFAGGYYLDKAGSQELIKQGLEQPLLSAEKPDASVEKKKELPVQKTEKMQGAQRKASSLPLNRFKGSQEWDPRMFVAERPKDRADETSIPSITP
ncbi:hypothetical protein [Legionella shakespearei]|uniref:Uncharacterized protein n=1 Tax=Legionella shakespearei DSM 23087 TaxID=1122169 RepID=A0A0W0YL21_9GAMM|nr:hypothetical protein [Legionella shakespearei]KTD57294.1 hypothetical protein Lsha_2676 [Legionella shakespearei DSM 23087]